MTQRDNLAATWVKYYQAKEDDDFWACEELYELAHSAPEKAWACIKEVFHLSSVDNVLSHLAAGPLEDLLLYHGESFIEEIEIMSRQNPSFAKLMKGVWTSEMPEQIQTKVNEIKAKYRNAL